MIAKRGNAIRCHTAQITTAKLDSFRCMKDDNTTACTWLTGGFFESDTTTVPADQADADSNCVLSTITFSATQNVEIIGASLYQHTAPTSSVFLYGTAAPLIPENLGGYKRMCHGGLDLKYCGTGLIYDMDGKAPKEFIYDPIYYSHQLRIRLFHDAGYKHDLQIRLLYYL
jgi:hypothetical protein